jgi:hypothetical protein
VSCPTWSGALDSFEAALHGQRTVLSGHTELAVPAFLPPDGLGALPVELLPRARALAAACAQLTAELEAASDHARQALAQSTPPQAPSQPAFLNGHA